MDFHPSREAQLVELLGDISALPGRDGPSVTRPPRVGLGGSNPPLCNKCPRTCEESVEIGIRSDNNHARLMAKVEDLQVTCRG
jgi:hypothetical protein